ncbi:MAG: ABC transporter substrate-binding protein [Nitrososphaerota archaeon]|jgi:iron complex transport system substrate-binding protein|uniref:ABC transporter substrate-binding protein n=1 Tax=Candidatus Bathycorpusculum sp. TaxID=2994959 RepID=UPI0028307C93|nr:ABC transporter substrate-binding protein [Candidatus Termiticorpusculum sp.]MCL2257043.1 ABC transporter substrate-binding protein [Candidatus Termiticorpusculum sp.]MCL2292831.1 ABC transporter substrate-binding protein [Candidatus Termiticorpusculum sp.]MDR0461394.1 ABC transporter substrate-binding protein [Nitrososphaerota archaeon]
MNNKIIVAIVLIAVIASASVYAVYQEFYATPPATQVTAQQQNPSSQPTPSSQPPSSQPTPSSTTQTATSDKSSSSSSGTQNTVNTPYYPLTVTDCEGTTVTIKSAPKRLVSLAPSITELVFAAGAGDLVVGVTDYCDYPYNFKAWIAAGNMTSIGNYWQPAVEPIMAVNPDLVFACGDGASNDAAHKLRDLGYTVIVLNPTTVQEILNDITLIGKVTERNSAAAATVSSLQTRINAITSKIADITDKPTVCYMMGTTYAAGSGCFISDLITWAGGVNAFSDLEAAYPQVSREAVIARNPDIIITSGSTNTFLTNVNWSTINAVINQRVYSVNNYNAYARNGPRFIDALEDIASKIHPELFAAP